MAKSKANAAERETGFGWLAGWTLLALALTMIPDQRVLRWKLLGVETASSALLVAALLSSLAGTDWTRTALDLPVALFGAATAAFWGLSPEPANSAAEAARALCACVAFFSAAQAFSRLRRPRWAMMAWSACAAACGARAIAENVFGAQRPEAGFGNPIFLGVFLASSACVCAGLLRSSRGLGARLAAGFLLALQLAGLWLSRSRAAWGGLLACAAVYCLFALKGAARACAAAAVAASAALLAFHFRGRAWTHGLIWSATWRLWLAHPLLGCGLGRFHLEFPAFASPALKALWPQGTSIVNHAHNEYLQTLAETGMIGLAALLAAPAAALSMLHQKRDELELEVGPAFGGLCVFFAAVASPDLRFGVTPFVAYSLLGAASALAWRRPQPPVPRAARVALSSAGLLLFACWAALAARPFLAERRLENAPAFHVDASPEVQARVDALEAALARDPEDAAVAEKLGYLYAQEKDWPRALERFDLAARLAPRLPGPLNNLGNVYYSLGQTGKAVEYWERSLAVDPRQADAHVNLAKLYYEQGRLKESARHLEAALSVDPANERARVLQKKMLE